jgi:hypothetical protein
VLGLIFLVQGSGMANVMPPATESVMSALPREKAGAGSAINNTARQVAVAMGVAVLGSVVSSIYRSEMSGDLARLPDGPRHLAGESIAGTMAVAERMGAAGQGLIEPARVAFVHAMHTATIAAAVIAFLGALVVNRWMPAKGAAGTSREPASAGERERAGV